MTSDWEDVFSHWAKPPGKTEQERLENAVRVIREALEADEKLSRISRVYLQGSYRNRVNVSQDSDVDLGILYTGNAFYPDYPSGKTAADFGHSDGSYTYSQFKNDVEHALVQRFGKEAVVRGNKAFDIKATSYRVEADVVPTFVHRRYSEDGSYLCGVELHPDIGQKIINWPERLYNDHHWPDQHYENGVGKNTATGRHFKAIVRILKKLRNEMENKNIPEARPIKGFVIECMVWNVPNEYFGNSIWDKDVQNILWYLWNNTKDYSTCSDWREVSDLIYLFHGSPPSKREQAHKFIDTAWDYIGVRE